MATTTFVEPRPAVRRRKLSWGELEEMRDLGLIPPGEDDYDGGTLPIPTEGRVPRKRISAHDVLNEAYHYAQPSSFSRGLRVELNGVALILISGTASVDENGRTIHVGDFRAQCWRTFRNITRLLESEGATWHDVIRTTCYLRDIERDYADFNEVRTCFYTALGLDPLPASTGIQARICREDLLVEIEAMAIVPSDRRQ